MTLKVTFGIVVACAFVLDTASVGAGAPADLSLYLMADRDAEIALARSAAPKDVAAGAAVLVLTRTGYVPAASGTNGFTCLVVRSFESSLDDFSEWWDPRISAPHCLNPAAVRTVLPEIERRAELVLQGLPAEQVASKVLQAYRSHELVDPEAGAMAYMLSHGQVLGTGHSHWMPHVMFYFGGGHKSSDWGATGPQAPVIDGGADASGVSVVMIPVPQWSDGSLAEHH